MVLCLDFSLCLKFSILSSSNNTAATYTWPCTQALLVPGPQVFPSLRRNFLIITLGSNHGNGPLFVPLCWLPKTMIRRFRGQVTSSSGQRRRALLLDLRTSSSV